ncbi:Uncharacterised protein (plasmid) [Tsukamurella tyrosinosolvens]|uniref:Uncharacterized protein n=1 Tax=Tsukamurella tyrosinosolvens TaxID=57704 RepID=A0A1H4ULQ1_TSUTY|nr:hypothetical protein [Tsukamurella tyrosinosolvens]KXO99061.1 hypothetical protein AXK58_24210 [Tsukamurella tyrosinosolvens]SEC69615.1 hypothetical protein SAMN04489793_2945 [Tsukamurella tyrosinosolvens]VEH94336.1 Uncharacterised protein [Tsukamurella tyrosinosolvens]
MSISEYATETVATWIISEGEELAAFGSRQRVASHAADCVRAGNLNALRELVDQAVHRTHGGRWSAAHEARDVLLAEGGLDVVDWDEVADSVRQSAMI